MKLLKLVLAVLLLAVSLVVAPPSWADPVSEKSPEYATVTQQLNQLLGAKSNPEAAGYTAAELQQKISDLQFQKLAMETTENWGVCRNQTGKTLGIYAHKAEKYVTPSALYYLAAGQQTDEDWDCDGVYLPSGAQVAGLNLAAGEPTQGQALTEPLAVKIFDGAELVVTSNPNTGELALNIKPTQVFKAGEGTWAIPNLSQAEIDAQVPNAPAD